MPTTYPHLNEVASGQIGLSDADRIQAIRQRFWLPYTRAKEVIPKMEDLLKSHLIEPGMMLKIHSLSEGMLGDFCDLVKTAAIDAIRKGTEEITLRQLEKLEWSPTSKRKQYVRLS